MFERFTDRARRVLVVAQEEARRLGHNYIGTEHILLGLLEDDESVAAKALRALDISLDGARAMVTEIIGAGDEPNIGTPPFTPRAKKTLELALREALQLGHNYIGTEHLLLGLVREGEGVGAQVLQSVGVTLERVREEVIKMIGGAGAATGAGTREYVEAAFASRPVGRSPSRGAGEAPFCPRCGNGLENNLGLSSLMVNGDVEDEAPIAVTVVYCTRCGFAIGTGPRPES